MAKEFFMRAVSKFDLTQDFFEPDSQNQWSLYFLGTSVESQIT